MPEEPNGDSKIPVPPSARGAERGDEPARPNEPEPVDGEGLPSFEEELAKLEACVRQLESGEASLEDALRLYEDGMALAERCQTRIEAAETRVAQLIRGERGIEERPAKDVRDS